MTPTNCAIAGEHQVFHLKFTQNNNNNDFSPHKGTDLILNMKIFNVNNINTKM